VSRQGTQPGTLVGDAAIFSVYATSCPPCSVRMLHGTQPLVRRRWHPIGSIAEVAKAHQILKDDGPKYCFSLVPHKISLWWQTMDCVRLRLFFDCRLDIDDNGLSLLDIVLVDSPVCSDNVMKQHLISKNAKVDVVLRMAADMDYAQIAMPLHRSCLPVVLFTSIFWSTPPDQTLPAAAMLGTLQRFWIERLLPRLTPLTMAQLRQAALPIKNGGIGHTVPSDVVQPTYLGSRLDTADAVAALPQTSQRHRKCTTRWRPCRTALLTG
jgi:hypothetical protein